MAVERKSILLVEDDVDLCALMVDFFEEQGFRLETANDGRRGLSRALEGGFDLILLDVMLPVLDGFEVLRQIRRRSSVPVIMLTARTEQKDRIQGLDAGADDYLPKPFGPEELVARIRAVLRRTGHKVAAGAGVLEFGELAVDTQVREVRRNEERIDLTSLEYDILEVLVRAAGRVVSRDELAAALYQREATPYERSLDVHISHVRKKLDAADNQMIKTIRGVGYMFAPVTK